MELFVILLSGLLGGLSPVGFIVDRVAQNAIRSRFEKVEQLQVRVDNAPSHQLIRGKVERVRIASRGLWVTPTLRIAALELETDPLAVDIQSLRQRGQAASTEGQRLPTNTLREPLQAGLRLVLTEQDINKLLESPAVTARLRTIGSRFLGNMGGQQSQAYEFVNPKVEFLANDRLRFQVSLQQTGEPAPGESNDKQLTLNLESGVGIVSGHQIQLISPQASINNEPVPEFLLSPLAQTLSEQLDLRKLQDNGITARLLKLDINQQQMEIAAFVKLQPPVKNE
ncbi:MAG TPA: DUF2993 domain-containing protein [Leptolyngbyaceae cyanobacterium]